MGKNINTGFSPNLAKSTGDRPSVDYFMKIIKWQFDNRHLMLVLEYYPVHF